MTKSESGETIRAPLQWPRYVFLGLVILSFVLAAEMSIYNPLNGSPVSPTNQNQRDGEDTLDKIMKNDLSPPRYSDVNLN